MEKEIKCKPLTLEIYLKGGPFVALRQQLMHMGTKNVLDFTGCALDNNEEFVLYRFRQLQTLIELVETESVKEVFDSWERLSGMLKGLLEDRSESVRTFVTDGTGPDDYGICKAEYVVELLEELKKLLFCVCQE